MKPVLFVALAASLLLAPLPARAAMSLNDLLFYGTESLDRGRFEQAGQAFVEALARDPENPYAKGRLALSLAASGQTEKAQQALEAAVAARGDDLFALWTLGCLELLGDRPALARTHFVAMVRADPGNVRGTVGLGLTSLAEGRTAEGVGRLAAAQESDSQDPLARYITGLAYWTLDAPANARLELEATLELDPRNTAALELLGLVYRRLGKTDLAKSAWAQALAVDQTQARARFFLSRLAEDEGLAAALADRPEDAKRAYGRALSIDPTNAAAAKALGIPIQAPPPPLPDRPTVDPRDRPGGGSTPARPATAGDGMGRTLEKPSRKAGKGTSGKSDSAQPEKEGKRHTGDVPATPPGEATGKTSP